MLLVGSASKDPNSFIFNSEHEVTPDKKIFDGVTHILSCIPPDKNGNDPVLKSLKNKLKSLSLEWVGYLSTTGVYGNTEGGWVSEIDQPNPFQKRSHNRLSCEKKWIESGVLDYLQPDSNLAGINEIMEDTLKVRNVIHQSTVAEYGRLKSWRIKQ